MSRVSIATNTLVSKVLLEKRDNTYIASGISTSDGKVFRARKEVIVSCGAFRTPQILMLSGIGASEQLHAIGVDQIIDAPQVGQNLHDRECSRQFT